MKGCKAFLPEQFIEQDRHLLAQKRHLTPTEPKFPASASTAVTSSFATAMPTPFATALGRLSETASRD